LQIPVCYVHSGFENSVNPWTCELVSVEMLLLRDKNGFGKRVKFDLGLLSLLFNGIEIFLSGDCESEKEKERENKESEL
jgi:hypothetical protein